MHHNLGCAGPLTLYVLMLRVASTCVSTGPVKKAATIVSRANQLAAINVGAKNMKKWMEPLQEGNDGAAHYVTA